MANADPEARSLPHAPGLPAVLWLVLLGACSGCPSHGSNTDVSGDVGCAESSCTELCMDALGCGGRCREGSCVCVCVDGGDGEDAGRDDGRADDGRDGAAEDSRDARDAEVEADGDAGDCEYRTTGETVAGASPGVVCRRLSVDGVERGLLNFAGDGSRVAISGGPSPISLWLYDQPTDCWSYVREARGAGGAAVAARAAVRGVSAQEDFTAVRGVSVAVSETRLTAAHARGANRSIAAVGPAGSAGQRAGL